MQSECVKTPSTAPIVCWRWRIRPKTAPVNLMKDDQASWSNVSGALSEHRRWILLKLQDVPANDGIEGLLERYRAGIALPEDHIPQRSRGRSGPGSLQSRRNSVYADDLACVTNHLRGKESDIARAATDVKHTHARDDPRFTEEVLGNRVDEPRLRLETIKLSIGMPKHILGVRISLVTGVHSRSSPQGLALRISTNDPCIECLTTGRKPRAAGPPASRLCSAALSSGCIPRRHSVQCHHVDPWIRLRATEPTPVGATHR